MIKFLKKQAGLLKVFAVIAVCGLLNCNPVFASEPDNKSPREALVMKQDASTLDSQSLEVANYINSKADVVKGDKLKFTEGCTGFVRCFDSTNNNRITVGYSVDGKNLFKGLILGGPADNNYYFFDDDGALLGNILISTKKDDKEYLMLFDGNGALTKVTPAAGLKIID